MNTEKLLFDVAAIQGDSVVCNTACHREALRADLTRARAPVSGTPERKLSGAACTPRARMFSLRALTASIASMRVNPSRFDGIMTNASTKALCMLVLRILPGMLEAVRWKRCDR